MPRFAIHRRCADIAAVLLIAVAATPLANAAAPAAVSTGISQDWQSQTQRAIAAQEYQLSAQSSASCAPVGYAEPAIQQAPNRAHNLRSCFTTDGVHVVPRTGAANWHWGLSLASFGDAGQQQSTAAIEPTTNGNRVEYAHGSITEWYVNDAKGLEQGFTLNRPVTAQPETVLRITVHGDLKPSQIGRAHV